MANSQLFTVNRYGNSASVYLSFQLRTAFLAGMTQTLPNSNLPRRDVSVYGQFNRVNSETADHFLLGVFPVIFGKKLGMVPYSNIIRVQTDDTNPSNFHPIWPYGNTGA